jgi:hypothetical protein
MKQEKEEVHAVFAARWAVCRVQSPPSNVGKFRGDQSTIIEGADSVELTKFSYVHL